MSDASPPDLDDDTTAARLYRLQVARESADKHRRDSDQRHEAARQATETQARDIAALRTNVAALAETVRKLDEAVTGKGGLREALDRMRGAIWLGALLAGLVGSGVAWLIGTTVDTRQTAAVHEAALLRLAEEDLASKSERRELREQVTRTASSVERLTEAMRAADRRIERLEERR